MAASGAGAAKLSKSCRAASWDDDVGAAGCAAVTGVGSKRLTLAVVAPLAAGCEVGLERSAKKSSNSERRHNRQNMDTSKKS